MSNPLLETTVLPDFDEIRPEHARPALEKIIAEQRQKIASLLEDATARDFDSLVKPLEEMRHELSRAWSPVSHLQAVLEDPAWRDAYNDVLPLMTEFDTEISQNRKLYEAYRDVAEKLPEDADPAQSALLKQALRDFRLAGVALDAAEKERYREIMQSLAAAQARFSQNVQDATDAWFYRTDDEAELAGLPELVLERARATAEEHGEDGFRIVLDFPNFQAVMTHAENRSLRREFYHGWMTLASDQGKDPAWDNSALIEEILALRHEAAQLTGFDNYAQYSLATKMAGSVEEVREFLSELGKRSRASALRELDEIRQAASFDPQGWDIPYYLEKAKQEKFDISVEELRAYFPVTEVKAGLFGVAEKLYGLSVVENPDVRGWHEDTRYYELRDADDALVGSFYTDLYARTGKRGGAWMDECIVRKNLDGVETRPVGYLVCNFPPLDADGESWITHNDVVTLFHEFGHMLHHLVTRVDYPSIAGVNGVPWDAVELPSQFMENFAWSYEVLRQATRHRETGEALPQALFQRLDDSRHFGEALQMLRQLEFALFDLDLHANYRPDEGGRVMEVLAAVRDEIAVIPYPDFNRQPMSFGHIFAGGYAAGYYSYKWAEVLAADSFAAFEESGIFDRSTATRFRREILEIGGSRNFMEAYVAFRGRKPTLEALLRQSGIDRAA